MQNSDPDPALEGGPGTAAFALACVTCRSRKLKCDRLTPVCTRCAKANIECVYPESRRKPAFKRRNVRELEERLAQVEGLLKDAAKVQGAETTNSHASSSTPSQDTTSGRTPGFNLASQDWFSDPTPDFGFVQGDATFSNTPDESPDTANHDFGELIDLGQFETLPPPEMIEDLHKVFFMRQQHFSPFVHPAKYLRSFYSAPHMRPPMCLQYAIWMMAANGHEKYQAYHDVFYSRARQYLESDELKGHGEHFLTVAHAQAWGLVATDEARCMLFTRASMSCARVVRLVQMMGLHRLDDPLEEQNPIAPTLAPPQTWAELEERRRIFWGAFCIDSHASITTGWPTLIDSANITTHLPSSEEAFNTGQEEETSPLDEAFNGLGYSTFAGAVIVCHTFNQMLSHVHRSALGDRPEDLEAGPFWKRHRDLDNMLSTAFMFLPERFRLPKNLRDPVAVQKNLNLHACVICLHMRACDSAAENNLPAHIFQQSQTRMLTAAAEIVNIMRLTSHHAGYRSPLVSLSLYSAAGVYIHQGKDDQSRLDVASLEFILQCMFAIGRDHLITRAHLQQAILDITKHGLMPRLSRRWHVERPFGVEVGHNIPLLTRSSVSSHSKPQPPLPGRLPLGQPIGSVKTSQAWDSPMRGMPWYFGSGSGSMMWYAQAPPNPPDAEEEESTMPGGKRKRGDKDTGGAEANPLARFMELPHRGSPSSSPLTGTRLTPATTATTNDETILSGSIHTSSTARTSGTAVAGAAAAADACQAGNAGADPGGVSGLDLFGNIDEWDEATTALLAQVTDFSPPTTDPWTLLNSGLGDGNQWDAN
ncbi:hypothetical protein GQ53DRAFT_47155 [Thozetella sp. PMI_491]|nr:hypothetical protein GQ53DRAFT_47155 [Thozetella sp. PMI_491]